MYKCPFCSFMAEKEFGLKLHVTRKHNNGVCPICGKKCKFLEAHILQKVIKAKDEDHKKILPLYFPNRKLNRGIKK